jgi:hypothetical protein
MSSNIHARRRAFVLVVAVVRGRRRSYPQIRLVSKEIHGAEQGVERDNVPKSKHNNTGH